MWEVANTVLERFHPYDSEGLGLALRPAVKNVGGNFDLLEAWFMNATQRRDREQIHQRIIAAAAEAQP